MCLNGQLIFIEWRLTAFLICRLDSEDEVLPHGLVFGGCRCGMCSAEAAGLSSVIGIVGNIFWMSLAYALVRGNALWKVPLFHCFLFCFSFSPLTINVAIVALILCPVLKYVFCGVIVLLGVFFNRESCPRCIIVEEMFAIYQLWYVLRTVIRNVKIMQCV